MIIKNRFMCSTIYESLSNENGTPKPRLLKLLEQLSINEFGFIIPDFSYISEGT